MGLSFACRDAGAACRWSATGKTEEELLRKIADHVQRKHKVKTVTDTIVRYAITAVKRR
jgi:predicted small metal-binding protein